MQSTFSPSIISVTDQLVRRNCPPGCVATHAEYGMVSVLAARSLQREIQFTVARPAVPIPDDAPDEVLYMEEFEVGTMSLPAKNGSLAECAKLTQGGRKDG